MSGVACQLLISANTHKQSLHRDKTDPWFARLKSIISTFPGHPYLHHPNLASTTFQAIPDYLSLSCSQVIPTSSQASRPFSQVIPTTGPGHSYLIPKPSLPWPSPLCSHLNILMTSFLCWDDTRHSRHSPALCSGIGLQQVYRHGTGGHTPWHQTTGHSQCCHPAQYTAGRSDEKHAPSCSSTRIP